MERLTTSLADRYRIERELGQGGMATVYLAEDLKHRRRVALKVLKPELAAVIGAERFVQEITTTASLQHPHILPLFDSGNADGFLYYVMPFIDGETLRAKLDRETQLGVTEAVKIATAVADALDYAHRHGVIHRDIKPENILLHDGRAVVADFGIALAVSAAAGGRMTETGLSLGTPHYMSPEQATAAKEITGRSDIYSLASVLYEMLAGDPPHTGASAQQIIMKIIAEQPQNVTVLRKSVPLNVAAALSKALEKLPADRFATAAEFASALNDLGFASSSTAAASRASAKPWRSWARDPRTIAALFAIAALSALSLVPRPSSTARVVGPETIRLSVIGPADSSVLSVSVRVSNSMSQPTISPDGKYVAFSVSRSVGSSLYVRALDSFDLLQIPGEGYWPFFSPDGRNIAFFREAELWTASIAERVPTRVGVIPERVWDINAAAWDPSGRIIVAGARGLWAFPARGGEPTLLLKADSTKRERFDFVDVLSDGRLLLGLTSRTGNQTEVITPDGVHRTAFAPGFERVRIVGDIMFYSQADQVHAAFFDLKKLAVRGQSVALADYPSLRPGRSIAWLDELAVRDLEPVLVTPNGVATPVGLPAGYYRWPRLSPDGGRLVVGTVVGIAKARFDVYSLRTLTRTPAIGNSEPVWTPDGAQLILSTGNRPLGGLLIQPSDGSRAPDTLLSTESGDAWPTGVSPDGKWLAFYGATLGVGKDGDADDPNDLFFLELATKGVRRVRLPGSQRGGRFSPDGHWFSYESTESGREEVHVRPWPSLDAQYVVSTGGGAEGAWSADGKELFFRHRDEIVAVPISAHGSALDRGPQRVLFSGVYGHDQFGDQSYDVAPDGRFLMMRPVPGGRVEFRVALNWIAEVRARLERGK